MIDKRKITWEEFEKHSIELANLLKRSDHIKGIVGVARGGLVATAIVCNALNIRNVKTVAIASYNGNEQMTAELLGSVDSIIDGEGWVFIDDLVDTGQTAKLLKKRYPRSRIAVVYAKPDGKEDIDFFVQAVPQETWMEFPWEVAKV